jgi:type I restriction enzyme, S subunit
MSEGNEKPLPSGWAITALSGIAEVEMGQSPPSSTYNTNGEGLPFFQGKAEFGDLYPAPEVWCSEPGKVACKDDILLSVRAPVGPTNLAPSKSCIGRGLAAISPHSGIEVRFLLHAIRRYATELDAQGTGTTFKAVSGKVVRGFSLPVAPSAEQIRIVDKLDELLSDLDAGVKALEGVRTKLKQYRAAVLKAAVEGTLTAEWRNQHPNTEPADKLLQRILTERRRRWDESQLQKFKAAGKEPPKNWKLKYQGPVSVDVEALRALPSSWCWITLDNAIIEGPQNGVYYPSKGYGAGTAILRIDDFQNGWLRDTKQLKRVAAPSRDVETYSLREGDLVLNRVNSMTHLGKCLLVPNSHHGVLFESNMMRAGLASEVSRKWIELYLHSFVGRRRLTKNAKWAVNQASINQEDVKRTPVPLPPVAEQKKVVELVETQLSVIDHLESDLGAKLNSATALRQSILKSAFEGRLVPQDPSDEPATELLKRIAAERAERERLAKPSRRAQTGKSPRGRKTKATNTGEARGLFNNR